MISVDPDQQHKYVEYQSSLHVYYTEPYAPVLEPESFRQALMSLPRKILFATSWSEFISFLKMHPESVCVNAAHFKNHSFVEVINMVETFSKLLNPHNTVTISIGVNHDTPYDLVKQAQKSSVMGIIPNVEFGHQETLRGLDAQFSNIPYWPRHVLEQLPGGPKNKSTANSTAINLTTRQQQLFDIVTTRGCSNKQAAKLLDISESTVKLHLSAIFKKYGVKNRTQLAVFSKRPN